MKKLLLSVGIVIVVTALPTNHISAQDPITLIIKEGVTKAIKAMDLKIQRIQTKTIWLQNAQKVVENKMSQLKLDEITGWVEKQRTLYKDYFDELNKVKSIISYYHRVREITETQVHMVEEYKRIWALITQDKHFTANEFKYMGQVYSGILSESVKNLDGLILVINSFSTQMSDAKRLKIIDKVADEMETAYNDLRRFNQQNILLRLQRVKTQSEIDLVKKYYGLQ